MNRAQQIYLMLGISHSQLLSHLKGKLPSSRKKGLGRKHQQGKRR